MRRAARLEDGDLALLRTVQHAPRTEELVRAGEGVEFRRAFTRCTISMLGSTVTMPGKGLYGISTRETARSPSNQAWPGWPLGHPPVESARRDHVGQHAKVGSGVVPPLRLGFDVEDRDGNLVARDGTCDADWVRELVQRANVLGVPFKVEVARGAGGVLVVGGGLWSGGGDQLRVEAAATAKLAIR